MNDLSETVMVETRSERNVGIELLRIVAMFAIVLGHVVRFAVLPECEGYFPARWLDLVTLVGVNVYAMISGYVMAGKGIRYAKLLPLWLTVLFYSLGIACVWRLCGGAVSLREWFRFCTPVVHGCWWYVTAYVGMYLFLPVVNRGLDVMTDRERRVVAVGCILAFSLLPNAMINRNVFGLNHGYSVVWLLACFVLGAILKRSEREIQQRISLRFLVWTLIGILVALGVVVCFEKIPLWRTLRLPVLYDSYVSPGMVLYAAMLLLLFSKMQFVSVLWKKAICVVGGVTLPVYLWHTHPLLLGLYFEKPLHVLKNCTFGRYLLVVFGIAIGVYVVGTLIGLLQKRLFSRIGGWISSHRGESA